MCTRRSDCVHGTKDLYLQFINVWGTVRTKWINIMGPLRTHICAASNQCFTWLHSADLCQICWERKILQTYFYNRFVLREKYSRRRLITEAERSLTKGFLWLFRKVNFLCMQITCSCVPYNNPIMYIHMFSVILEIMCAPWIFSMIFL
jgi:hypothetical protein